MNIPARLLPLLRPLFTTTRSLSTIPSLLSTRSSTKPLKDALKFSEPAPKRPAIFTYHDLHTHTTALANGLQELSYAPSNRLLSLLHPSSPESTILLLAAAHLNLSVVSLPLPSNPSQTSVKQIADALEKYQPRALFLGKEFLPDLPSHDDQDGIIAAVHPLINALSPGVALSDSRGLDGFVPLTGRPFESPRYPYLQHVVHTADDNFRGTMTFKSLLVYSGNALKPVSQLDDAPLWTSVETGDVMSESQLLEKASEIANNMQLSSDHTSKNGKVVIKPRVSSDSIAAVLAAVMKESLCVSPGVVDFNDVAQAENALVL